MREATAVRIDYITRTHETLECQIMGSIRYAYCKTQRQSVVFELDIEQPSCEARLRVAIKISKMMDVKCFVTQVVKWSLQYYFWCTLDNSIDFPHRFIS